MSLASVAIPDSVTSLGADAFFGCSGLTSVTIGHGVTSIGVEAFSYCTGLTGVTIPTSVTSIGDDAFAYCASLTGISIPASVTSIGNESFYECTSLLGSVSIGNGVTNIGTAAFADCTMNSVSIGNRVTSIGATAFAVCTKLTSVAIPDSVTSIGAASFEHCTSLTVVTFGSSVTNIGNQAFLSCSSLTNVTIPDSVTNIGGAAFDGCTSLSSVAIGNRVISIGSQAFALCPGLTNVSIGSSVTSIGGYAFYNCTSLTKVYFQGNSPTPTNDLTVFYGDTPGTIYYQPSTTGWGALFDGWPTMSNVVSSAIGSVSSIHGNVTVTHMGGQPQPLNLNDPIQEGDVIETDKSGAVDIGFINNTDLNLSHNAKITIDEYVYDPNAQTGTFQVQHNQGSIWCKDGQISNGCQINTVYGYTGIRGTEFIEQLDPCSSNEVVYLIEGELAIMPKATGVTNIVDAPATIVFDASNFSTSALTQATYDAMLAQVNQTNETFASWQGQYFGCINNPDAAPNAAPSGDGQDNFTKFLAGMNTTNPAAYFHILSATPQGNDELVSWMCGGGRTNVLQATTNLGGSWFNASPNIVLAGSGDCVTNYLDVGAVTNATARFYRVLLVQ